MDQVTFRSYINSLTQVPLPPPRVNKHPIPIPNRPTRPSVPISSIHSPNMEEKQTVPPVPQRTRSQSIDINNKQQEYNVGAILNEPNSTSPRNSIAIVPTKDTTKDKRPNPRFSRPLPPPPSKLQEKPNDGNNRHMAHR